MANTYIVRESDGRGFEEELVRLWSTSFSTTSRDAARAKLHHSYSQNPAGSAQVFTVHVTDDPAPVGVQSLLPRTYVYQGQPVRVASVVDYAVDARHRSLGPALMLFRRCSELGVANFDFLVSTPNKVSKPVALRAGMRVIGSTDRYVKVMRSKSYLLRAVPSFVASAAAIVVDAVIPFLDTLRRMRDRTPFQWREVSAFDPALNEIWQEHPAHLLLARRTAEMLSWRFTTTSVSIPWRVWLAGDAQGSPQGYVIWRQQDGLAQIGDFFCRAPESKTRALLVGFCCKLRNDASIDAVVLSFFGSRMVTRLVRSAGFWPGRGGHSIVVKAAKPEAIPAASTWYYTPFDADAD